VLAILPGKLKFPQMKGGATSREITTSIFGRVEQLLQAINNLGNLFRRDFPQACDKRFPLLGRK